MRAVEITRPGGPETLSLTQRDRPAPGYGEVLIEIAFAGVNRPDALQRAGLYNPPPGASDLPGLECAGQITVIGPGVTDWEIGTPVCALLPGGGYAEYAITPAAHCLPVPAGLSLHQAACLPETLFTTYSNLVMRGQMRPGQRVLIHGGSSGIGTTAIQLATALGARVFATAGSDEKCAACQSLGAEHAINYREEDFVQVLRDLGGVDLILDMVGGDYIPRNLKALAPEGRLVQIAFLQGPKAQLNLAPLMMQRQHITGSTLRPQSNEAKARIARALRRDISPLLATGRIAPVLDQFFALENAADAHRRMESSQHIGKIALRI